MLCLLKAAALGAVLSMNVLTLSSAPARAGEVGASHADIRAAERVLGYSPEYDFEAAIGRTVRWYAEQRDLGFL